MARTLWPSASKDNAMEVPKRPRPMTRMALDRGAGFLADTGPLFWVAHQSGAGLQ